MLLGKCAVRDLLDVRADTNLQSVKNIVKQS